MYFPLYPCISYNKYKSFGSTAITIIVHAVDPKLLYLLGILKSLNIVRKKLQDTFEKKSWANKLRPKRKLSRN